MRNRVALHAKEGGRADALVKVLLIAMLGLVCAIGLLEMLLILVEAIVVSQHARWHRHMLTSSIERGSWALHAKKAAWTSPVSIFVAIAGGLHGRLLFDGHLGFIEAQTSHRECVTCSSRDGLLR